MKISATATLKDFREFIIQSICKTFIEDDLYSDPEIFPERLASEGTTYIEAEDKEIIEDISFETFGCAAAIASSSIATEMAKGKPLDEAEKITKMEIVEELGGLPEPKIHCSVMVADGLKEAIKVYREKKK